MPKKEVSGTAYPRLSMAADAIAATKKVIAHQGNQVESLRSTKLNSAFRLDVMLRFDVVTMEAPIAPEAIAAASFAEVEAERGN